MWQLCVEFVFGSVRVEPAQSPEQLLAVAQFMKTHAVISRKIGVLFLAAFAALSPAAKGVNLNINPSVITNDYVGKITLTIGGLTNGQPVKGKRFCDFNGNGVIDAGQDFVIRGFGVTDGQLPMIGGVRNSNVPGDEDGMVDGQIMTKLDFPGMDIFDGASGTFIFAVTDPQTGDVLSTQPFTVVQKVLPQGARGQITSSATGLALTNGLVALSYSNRNGGMLTLPDSNGCYTFYAPPGNYILTPVFSNYLGT